MQGALLFKEEMNISAEASRRTGLTVAHVPVATEPLALLCSCLARSDINNGWRALIRAVYSLPLCRRVATYSPTSATRRFLGTARASG